MCKDRFTLPTTKKYFIFEVLGFVNLINDHERLEALSVKSELLALFAYSYTSESVGVAIS